MGELLTVPEVAEYLKVSQSWVRQRTKANELKHIKLGGNIRYRAEDIAAYLQERTQGDNA